MVMRKQTFCNPSPYFTQYIPLPTNLRINITKEKRVNKTLNICKEGVKDFTSQRKQITLCLPVNFIISIERNDNEHETIHQICESNCIFESVCLFCCCVYACFCTFLLYIDIPSAHDAYINTRSSHVSVVFILHLRLMHCTVFTAA